jgi:fatty acid-binding protein DegV
MRHLFETFEEFMAEFETPAQIALLRGRGQESIRTRPLRQFVQEAFPTTHYSEHAMSPTVEALFGTKSIALVIQDLAQEKPG